MAEFFTNIAGNTSLCERLGRNILNGSLTHAYIIEGRPGSGRKTLALNIAAALCCEDRHSDRFPCLACRSCRKILEGKTPDVIRISAEAGKVGIGVNVARFIRTDVMTVPNDFDFKVYIIEDADNLTPQAQNALLLTLEEPHSYAVFLLICTSASNLLETVRSRAPIIRTEPVTTELLSEYLISHDERARSLASSPEDFAALLSDANGLIGRALTLLDPKERKPGAERRELAERFVRLSSSSGRASEKIKLISAFSSKREDVIPELETISLALRDLVVLKKSDLAPLCFFSDRDDALEICDRYTLNSLLSLIARVDAAVSSLYRNANLRLVLTNLIF